MAGPAAKLFWIWVSIVRYLLIPVVVHENVVQFGWAELCEFFSDLYIVITTHVDSVKQGWPIMRLRQFTLMLLKVFHFNVLNDRNFEGKVDGGVTDVNVELFKAELQLQTTLDQLFARECSMNWEAFVLATQDDLDHDLQWAASRKLVKERWSVGPNPYPDDDANSYEAALTPNERKRYEWCKTYVPGEVRDVQQNPDKFVLGSKGPNFNTFIKNMGILMLPSNKPELGPPRALVYRELFSAMGFPVYEWAIRATSNTTCSFSCNREPPAERTRTSAVGACGNAMHVNSIGSIHFWACLAFPYLGSRTYKHNVHPRTGEPLPLGNATTREIPGNGASSSASSSTAARPAASSAHLLPVTTNPTRGTRPLKLCDNLRRLKRAKSGDPGDDS